MPNSQTQNRSTTMDAKAPRKKMPDEQQNSLTASKDRAQLTATTAMSIVHVALLNTLINDGAEKHKFYTPILVMICVTLAIQVIIGILAILVTQIRNYYDKFNSDMCDELCICCPRRRKKLKRPHHLDHYSTSPNSLTRGHDLSANRSGIGGLDTSGFEIRFDDDADKGVVTAGDTLDAGIPNTSFQGDSNTIVKTNQPRLTASPGRQDRGGQQVDQHISLDDWTFDNYDHIDVLLLKSELRAIDAEMQLKQMLEEDRLLQQRAGNPAASTATTEVVEEESRKNRAREERRHKLEQLILRRDVLAGQKEALSKRVDSIHQADILKKVSFWQNIINYLLYFVFVANAFITGLGVAGKTETTVG